MYIELIKFNNKLKKHKYNFIKLYGIMLINISLGILGCSSTQNNCRKMQKDNHIDIVLNNDETFIDGLNNQLIENELLSNKELFNWKKYLSDNHYDSDAISDDTENDKSESNIYNYLNLNFDNNIISKVYDEIEISGKSYKKSEIDKLIKEFNEIVIKYINELDIELLNEYKDKIIEYFTENKMNLTEFKNIRRKEFCNSIKKYCNNNKLHTSILKLYKSLETKYKN